MPITLTATAGPHLGKTFTFAEHDTFLVGRSKNTHFRLARKDMYFSRLHFMVEVNPPRCRILDMGSRNGTFVNGQRITDAELHDGDEIRAGHTLLHVSFQNDPVPGTDAEPEATVSWMELPPVSSPEAATLAEPAQPPAAQTPAPIKRTLAWEQPTAPCPVCAAPRTSAVQLLCPECQGLANSREQTIPGYQIVRELGRGAMGMVSLAVRQADGARVAIKTIIPAMAGSNTQTQRFLREASILRELQHPHIVSFCDMGEAQGQLYFVMDHIQGTDAKQLLKRHGKLDVRVAVRMICQVLQGLAHAHDRGFVHRDIKPANILVAHEDGYHVAKLADFGLARVYHSSQMSGLTMKGDVGGTLPYLSPEQITHYRDVKPTADQYSTAATLYHLMTGQYVYDLPAQTHAAFLKILEEEPVPLRQRRADVPEGLAAVVHRALARQAGDRFADVRSFRKALIPFAK